VIRVVIGQHQRLAENRLALSVRNRRAQIGLRVFHQLDHFLEVVLEFSHALRPGSFVLRSWGLRPVALGKTGRNMLCVAAEFQQVPPSYTRLPYSPLFRMAL